MDGVNLQEVPVEDLNTGEKALDRRINWGSTNRFPVDSGSECFVNTIVQVCLLLGTRKGDEVTSVEVGLELFLPCTEGCHGSVVEEFLRLAVSYTHLTLPTTPYV